jgi:hypothetical protein
VVHLGFDRYANICLQVPGVLASVQLARAERQHPQHACESVLAAQHAAQLALAIDRGHGAALVTKAEAHTAAARLTSQLGPDYAADATQQWQLARDTYRAALHKPRRLGSCSERCTVRYNYACVLAWCQEESEALAVLLDVAARSAAALKGAAEDADLALLTDDPEFLALMQRLQ